MAEETVLATVEGPKGKAEIVEVATEAGGAVAPVYQVRFNDTSTAYPTLGEAYIEAGLAVGDPV
ncbi:MAG: hypothetical protein IIC31_09660 [Chloroflexi bacterium]|nr:hypothetical protein [Chloroflexota bacterium]